MLDRLNPFRLLQEWKVQREVRRIVERSRSRTSTTESQQQGASIFKTEVKQYQFIWIGLEEIEVTDLCRLVERVCDTIGRRQGVVESISSFLIVGNLGVPFAIADPVAKRQAIVDELLRENGDLVRIVHGQVTGPVGMIGSKHRFAYGPVVRSFSEINEKLSEVPFGSAVET